MSYLTVEVDIEQGVVVPKTPEKLPSKGKGLLTILQPLEAEPPKLTQLEALEALQKHLQLDEAAAAQWMATVRDARR